MDVCLIRLSHEVSSKKEECLGHRSETFYHNTPQLLVWKRNICTRVYPGWFDWRVLKTSSLSAWLGPQPQCGRLPSSHCYWSSPHLWNGEVGRGYEFHSSRQMNQILQETGHSVIVGHSQVTVTDWKPPLNDAHFLEYLRDMRDFRILLNFDQASWCVCVRKR